MNDIAGGGDAGTRAEQRSGPESGGGPGCRATLFAP
jgi:hypothetical protein